MSTFDSDYLQFQLDLKEAGFILTESDIFLENIASERGRRHTEKAATEITVFCLIFF